MYAPLPTPKAIPVSILAPSLPTKRRAVSGNTPAMTAKQMTQMRWMSVDARQDDSRSHTRICERESQRNGERHQHFRFRLFMLKVWRRQPPLKDVPWVCATHPPPFSRNAYPALGATRWAVRRLNSSRIFFPCSPRWGGIYHVGQAGSSPEFGISRIDG